MKMSDLAVSMDPETKPDKALELKSISVEPADEGGFIARCSMEGRKDGRHEWEEKTKIFTSSKALARFVEKKMSVFDMDEDY